MDFYGFLDEPESEEEEIKKPPPSKKIKCILM
jgi:hypothetical protein